MTTIRIDPSPRRIRVRLGEGTIADSTTAKLVYQEGEHPEYHFPMEDLDWTALIEDPSQTGSSPLGSHHDVSAQGTVVGRRYLTGPAQGLVQLSRDQTDTWFEEDEVLDGHPRDPYRRVDVVESSRHVEVRAGGRTVASTTRPRLVAETGLPARWYVPASDVDWSLLSGSATGSYCQYKGTARWWNLALGDEADLVDIAWAYEQPMPEAPKLAGLVSFFAEHDAIEVSVDGVVPEMASFTQAWVSPSLHLENQQV